MKIRDTFKIEDIDGVMQKYGYYASPELKYKVFLGLFYFGSGEPNPGQAIFALCLEGPPGAGKTEYAEVYTKLIKELWDGDVEFIDYQCDATTGKTELFEDINISAAIKGDADNVNISGKLVEAIKKVNEGKKVVLFLDEYDKAREETDTFLLNFLQSGKINSTQHGDLKIKKEYKSNLQVILCKNNTRENLSGPLSRRIRIARLDYMLPDTFYTVARRQLVEDQPKSKKVDDGVINLVSLIYSNAYNIRELFSRLPACSEMIIAIKDADNLIKYANAPKHIVYRTIIENMFKEKDDLKTFEANVSKSGKGNNGNPELKDLLSEMATPKVDDSKKESLTDLIAKTVFKNETAKMQKKIEEAATFVDEYEQKFAELEARRNKAIDTELEKVTLGDNVFVSEKVIPDTIGNFQDETAYIKRGKSVFSTSEENWVEVASSISPQLNDSQFVSDLIKHAKETEITVYEDGFLISKQGDFRLAMTRELDENRNKKIRFFSNTIVLPSTALNDIFNAIKFVSDVSGSAPSFTLDCLVYNDSPLATFELVENQTNVYKVQFSSDGNSDLIESLNRVKDEILPAIKDSNIDEIVKLSKVILKEESSVKRKTLKGV